MGYTQAQLAERVAVDVETISRFERGKHFPSLTMLHDLSNHLHMPVEELLKGCFKNPGPPQLARLNGLFGELRPADQAFVIKHMEQMVLHLVKRT